MSNGCRPLVAIKRWRRTLQRTRRTSGGSCCRARGLSSVVAPPPPFAVALARWFLLARYGGENSKAEEAPPARAEADTAAAEWGRGGAFGGCADLQR